QAARAALHPAFVALDAALAGSMAVDAAFERVGTALERALEGDAGHASAAQASPAAQDALAAPATVADAARELFPEFMQESLDYLAQAEAALLALEADAAAAGPVNDVLRAFHTIKGTSSFLGLDAISALAHDA